MPGSIRRYRIVVRTVVALGAIVGMLLFWRSVERTRDAATRVTCNGRMCGLALAMHYYHDQHGHFPPAYVLGPDGKPWHSWRVLILPYLGDEGPQLYEEYTLDEPWDGPQNRKLHSRMHRLYACPGDPDNLARGRTNFFVVVGPDSAFPGVRTTKLDDITRPREQTILFVEAVGRDIPWLEPRDLSVEDMNFETDERRSPSISSKHRSPHVGMADGSRQTLHGVSPDELRTMLRIGSASR